jgi:hypothetical protein
MSSELEIDSSNLRKEVEAALTNEIASRHSYFQLKYFVIGKEPTNQAKMWQCLRELKSRYESLVALELEIEENQDNLELLDIKISRVKTKGYEQSFGNPANPIPLDETTRMLNQKEYEINLRKLERQKKSMLKRADQLVEKHKFLEEEIIFFLNSFKNLEKIEKLKPFDDLQSQKEYWGNKLAEKINLKMLLQNPLDTELAETILALPDDIPVKQQMINRFNTFQKQLTEVKEECRKKLQANKGA